MFPKLLALVSRRGVRLGAVPARVESELSKKYGVSTRQVMTHSRSVIQNEIDVAKKSLVSPSGGAPSARGAQPLAGVSKPPTARNS